MSRNGSTVAGVAEHHALLHRPCVITSNEPNQTVIAISAAGCVCGVHRFGLHKETVELGENGGAPTLVVAELEEKIGRFREASTGIIGPLALSAAEFKGPFAKPAHFA